MRRSVDTANSATKGGATRGRKYVRPHTDYLFSRPGFWSGVASVLDLFGRLDAYNYSRTEQEADRKGLCTDYYMIGQDFWDALRTFESEYRSELPQQYRLFDPDEVRHAS